MQCHNPTIVEKNKDGNAIPLPKKKKGTHKTEESRTNGARDFCSGQAQTAFDPICDMHTYMRQAKDERRKGVSSGYNP